MPRKGRKTVKPKRVLQTQTILSTPQMEPLPTRITRSQTSTSLVQLDKSGSSSHNAPLSNVSDYQVVDSQDNHSHDTDSSLTSVHTRLTPIPKVSPAQEEGSNTHLYCYSTCKAGRYYDRDMVQCSFCMAWFHTSCTDFTISGTIWACNACRTIHVTVAELKDQLQELHQSVSIMQNAQHDHFTKMCELATENAKLQFENKKLKSQLYEYRLNTYNQLTSDSSSDDSFSDSDNEDQQQAQIVTRRPKQKDTKRKYGTQNTPPRNKKSTTIPAKPIPKHTPPISKKQRKPKLTIIGDSMLRGSGNTLSSSVKDYETCVLSTSGYTISRAASHVSSLAEDHHINDIIVLSVGTNDVENHNHEQLTEKYSRLIDQTKKAAPDSSIIITAIPNRITPASSSTNRKIDNLNRYLRSLCEQDAICWFADCTPEIKLNNYKYDGLHLSLNGISHFISVLSEFINANFHIRDIIPHT